MCVFIGIISARTNCESQEHMTEMTGAQAASWAQRPWQISGFLLLNIPTHPMRWARKGSLIAIKTV